MKEMENRGYNPDKTWKNLAPPRTAPTKVCYFFETDPHDRPHLTW